MYINFGMCEGDEMAKFHADLFLFGNSLLFFSPYRKLFMPSD